jgi:glycosyltransferase involved in cell wall biosynthesis
MDQTVDTSATGQNSKPLRILHYVPAVRLEQGGVVRSILDWCTVFTSRGHQMSLVVYENKDVPRDWLDAKPGHPRAYIVPQPLPPLKLLGVRAMRQIDQLLQDADVLHLHGPWLDGNRQIARLARKRHVPYLLSTHGMLDDWSMTRRGWKKKIYLSLAGRRTLNSAAMIHCTAEAELSQASKWFDNPHTTVLPYLVDLSPFTNLPGPQSALDQLPSSVRELPKLLFLSRLHEQKGVDILIRATALLRDAGISFITLLAGSGDPIYEGFLHSLVAELNLGNHIVFTGLLTGIEKLSLYNAADIFVLPTQHENFGLVLTEAMACGLPVITTKGTDIWQEIQSAGAIIADSTPESIAAEIKKMLGDPADRSARASRGRNWVFANLAVDPLSQKYESLYRKLITPQAGV